jgi:hypothetical protein
MFSPTRRTLAFLQRAQQLRLRARRQLAGFVEEQRALIRLLEQAGPLADGAGERALRVAEELGFEQLVGQRGAVHGAEPPGAARAARVDRARDELLAAAALPFDEDRIRRERRAPDGVAHAIGGGAASEQIVGIAMGGSSPAAGARGQRLEHRRGRGGRPRAEDPSPRGRGGRRAGTQRTAIDPSTLPPRAHGLGRFGRQAVRNTAPPPSRPPA